MWRSSRLRSMLVIGIAAVVGMSGAGMQAQKKLGGEDTNAIKGLNRLVSVPNPYAPSPYYLDHTWPQPLPGNVQVGMAPFALDPDPEGNIWVLGRGKMGVLKFDRSGKFLASFGEGMFVFPHGFHVDREGNIWVADAGIGDSLGNFSATGKKGNQVFKFSPEGKVLMTLGMAGVSRNSAEAFISPTDVAVAPSGDIYVTDGHLNRRPGQVTDGDRVVRFSRDGKFIKAFGKQGIMPGEFWGVHSIAIDSQGRVFVADRSNNRIQIFDSDGNFLDLWKQFGRPSGVVIKNDVLYVTDSETTFNPGWAVGVRIGSVTTGAVTAFIPGVSSEMVTVDDQGNVYLAPGGTIVKYARVIQAGS